MDSAILKQLDALGPEQVIGPEHHRFRLKQPLSPHPLGQLWQAEDISTTKPTPVTLLFLSAELLAARGFVERLRDQLNRNRALSDRFAARCYGLFAWRGLFFTSWEPLDGLTLARMLDNGQARKLNERQKRGLITQVGQALEAHLQQTGQPHATLCPELIFINRSNGVRLMGYGWRPLLEPLFERLPLVPGYHAWQSPDAFHPNLLDAREDVYALASLIYQLLGGKAAFTKDDDEEIRRSRELKSPGGLSREQWSILQSALAADADQRPATPLELVRRLYQPDASTDATPSAPEDSAEALNTSAPADADLAPADRTGPVPATRPSLRTRLRLPDGSRRAAAAALLFATGVALGYWLGWQSTATDMSELTQLRAQNARLQQAITRPGEPPADTHRAPVPDSTSDTATPSAADAPDTDAAIVDGTDRRQSARPADNLTVFRDQWGPDRYAPQMVVVPKGRFRMGDLHGRGDDNEYPVHDVIIERAFALSRHEVTFDEYDQFAEDTGRPLPDDEGWGRGRLPVINVSWEDARDYAAWLAEQTGEPYRLPTEAEWEYAARAGTETIYWWGDALTAGMANCDGCGSAWDGRQPAPVGSLPANPWGLHDLNGNVDEWVQDCYAASYAAAPTDGSANTEGNCQHRVMRGGSWFDIPRLVRSASRYRHPPDSHRNSWGFRVALDLTAP